MNYVNIQQLIEQVRKIIPLNLNPANTGYDVAAILSELLHSDQWNNEQKTWLVKLAFKIDVTPKLCTHYTTSWRHNVTAALDDRWLSVAALLLYKYSCMEFAIKEEYLLKHLNTLLKLLSTIDSDVLQLKPILQKQIKNELHQLITSLQKAPTTHFITEPLWNDISTNELEILPITILFSEGPIARAYLATLRSLGLTPQKIIHLVASHDVATRKPVGRLIPARWRARYAAGVQYSRMHYWPKRIAKEFPKLTRVLIDAITSTYHFDPDTITEANKSLPLTTYCAQVESLMVTSLRDPKLYEYLQQLPEQILLFTGGGIVPKELLEIPGLKFLHVHPGFLPEVRGADGLLWSGLLSGNPAASAFYLSPGIDTGAIVMASRLPAMQIPDLSEHDCKTLYRALYSYFDPWVRSCVLRQLLLINPKISHWPTTAQNEEDGVTFHFMQPWLQKLAILRLFGGLSSG